MALQKGVTVVVGGQWGDEGKGKLVDHLATDADFVCRYNVSEVILTANRGMQLPPPPPPHTHTHPFLVQSPYDEGRE